MVKKTKFSYFLVNLSLAVLGALLFALSHPNYLYAKGFLFIAYFATIPFFLLIKRTRVIFSFFWGTFSLCLAFFIFNFWMFDFHPIAMFVVLYQTSYVYGLLFLALKITDIYFGKYSFILNAAIWVAFEYFKILGFIGYPYGIIAYTQWSFPALIRSASIFGVWGISFLLIACSSIIVQMITKEDKKLYFKFFFVWVGVFVAFILYGTFSKIDYTKRENYEKSKIALIQPNRDPWIGNIEVYKQNFYDLKNLSEKVIKNEPNLDLIVWPETAFIPRIKWHYKYSSNSESSLLVRQLLEFLNKQEIPFLIGNDDAVFNENLPNIVDREDGRIDYNAALLFIPKKNVLPPNPETYRKIHLVPFTEHFPYQKIFPKIYRFLIENDTHFWAKGEKRSIFKINNLKFGTPICFEDCFGYISRDFVQNGANVIINLTNDAWAKSLVSQYQHFSMAVFRAVENRIPVLRSTISGQTAIIDRNGVVVSMLEPFISDYLIAEISIPKTIKQKKEAQTIYSVIGDSFAILCVIITAIATVLGIFNHFNIKIGEKNEKKETKR